MLMTLYHGTDLEAAKEIEKDKFTVKKNPKHWLGNGIYFFTDKALAKWWTSGPTKKFGTEVKEPAILEVTVEVDEKNILDLRQFEQYSELAKQYRIFLEMFIEHGVQKISDERFRCLFFDWYMKVCPNIDIIIANFFSLKQPYICDDAKSFFGHTYIEYGETQVCLKEHKQSVILRKEILS